MKSSNSGNYRLLAVTCALLLLVGVIAVLSLIVFFDPTSTVKMQLPTDESWKPGDPFEAPQPVVVPPDYTPTTTMMSSDHGAKEDTFPYSVGTPAPISEMRIGDMLWVWDDFILNQTQARLYRLQDLCVKVKLEGAELPVPGRTGDMIVVMTTQTPPSPGQGAQVVAGTALIRNLAEGSKEQETCLESGD